MAPTAIFERSYPDNYVSYVAMDDEKLSSTQKSKPHRSVSEEIAHQIKGKIEYGKMVTNSDVEKMESEETQKTLEWLAQILSPILE